MKILIKVTNGLQSYIEDVTHLINSDETLKIKEIKIKDSDLETYSDTYVYQWFDEFYERKTKPFWINQSHSLIIEVIKRN